MQNPILLNYDVWGAFEILRISGVIDLRDRRVVLRYFKRHSFHAAYLWVKDNPSDYYELIKVGYKLNKEDMP